MMEPEFLFTNLDLVLRVSFQPFQKDSADLWKRVELYVDVL